MLGRLAKGVGGLAKGVAGVALGEARAVLTAVPNDESEVEGLLQRISGSLLPEYRRQAMSQLKDLLVDNPKAQLAFGAMGIPILVAILRDDRDDVALLQGALEALVAATTSTAADGHGGASKDPGHPHAQPHAPVTAAEAQAAAVNAELFAQQREYVGLLLGLLEDEPVGVPDFYVRYHAVQLLTALLGHCAARLQEAILATPMSVVRLTELLGERSEVIRNEALLLLAALTRSEGTAGGGGSEVQKIAAFEGAFDRVAELLQEEGGLEGGMVVQDGIELMNNLLRGNMANQRLFREMGHIAMLPRMLTAAVPSAAAGAGAAGADSSYSAGGQFPAATGPIPFLNAAGGADGGGDEPSLELHNALAALAAAGTSELMGPPQLPRQKVANMLSLLETLRLLCAVSTASVDPDRSTEQSNRVANQAKLLAAGALEALTAAALRDGGVPSAPVRAAALGTLGDLVDGAAAGQERLSRATVRQALAEATAAMAEGRQAAGGGAAAAAAGQEPVPVLQAVLHVALYSNDAAERAAADHVIACYCRGNPDGQLGLAATLGSLADSSAANGGSNSYLYGNGAMGYPSEVRTSFGQDLVAALLVSGGCGGAAAVAAGSAAGSRGGGGGGGLLVTCRAAGVLQHLLSGNASIKQRLLTTPLEAPPGPGALQEYLMPRVIRQLTAAWRPPDGDLQRLVVCTLMRLLLVWLHDCPPAVAALLDGPPHLPLLVDLVTGRQGPAPSTVTGAAAPPAQAPGTQGGDPVVCGLAACVLASCMLYGKPLATVPPMPTAVAVPPPASDLVLDVVMSRIGLSLFFFRLDDLKRSAVFATAGAAPCSAAKPLTRAAAAAAAVEHVPAADTTDSFQLGHDVAGVISRVEDAVRRRTMEAFARPTGHRGQDPVPSSPAEVPGHDDSSRLGWAVTQLSRLAREVDELRGRNRALAEDLFRLSQGLGSAPSAPSPPGAAPQGAPTAGPASTAVTGLHGHGPPPHAMGPAVAGPGTGAGMGVGMGMITSAADVEARVALELRAGRAEAEVAGLRQQLELLAARLSQAEADAAAAREAAATAHLAASKAEADLEDLSGAYNNLEAHAFATEAQLRSAQGALAAAQAAAAQAETRAAAAEARAAATAGHALGPTEADIQQRIDEAVATAKAEVEDGMTDLFVCLGQEERKVEALSRALAGFGVNVEEVLADVAEEEPAEEL